MVPNPKGRATSGGYYVTHQTTPYVQMGSGRSDSTCQDLDRRRHPSTLLADRVLSPHLAIPVSYSSCPWGEDRRLGLTTPERVQIPMVCTLFILVGQLVSGLPFRLLIITPAYRIFVTFTTHDAIIRAIVTAQVNRGSKYFSFASHAISMPTNSLVWN